MEPATSTVGAILIVGHFIVSVFQFQLGNPVFQFVPYPNMEICHQYVEKVQGQFPISTEYTLIKQAQCMTETDFAAAMAARQQQANEAAQTDSESEQSDTEEK